MKLGTMYDRRMRGYHTCIGLAFLTGVILRWLHVHYLAYSPMSDMQAYLTFRSRFFDLHVSEGTVLFPPGLPFALQILKLLAGLDSLKPLLYAQATIDAGSILFLAAAVRYLFNCRAAILAAWLYAAYHPSILYTGLILPEALCVDGAILAIFAFTRYLKRPSPARAAFVAFVAAIAIYFRSNVAVMVPVFSLYCILSNGSRIHLRHRFVHGFIVAAGALLVLFPWCYRNSVIAGRPVFVSDNVGYSMMIGNNPLSDGSYMEINVLPDFEEKIGKFNTLHRHKAMEEYGREFITSNPDLFLFYLIPSKLRYLFTEYQWLWPWDLDHIGYNYSTDPLGPLVEVPLLRFFCIAALGLIGLIFPGRRARWLMLCLWLAMVLPLLVLLPSFRYRSSADFLLIIGTAVLIQHAIPTDRFKRILLAVLCTWCTVALLLTLLNCLRFNGPNILRLNSVGLSANGSNMINDEYKARITEADLKQPFKFFIGDFDLGRKKDSHLQFGFDYSILPLIAAERGMTPNISIEFFDETSRTVTQPISPRWLLPGQVELNDYQANGGHAWRVVNIPAYARYLRLGYVQNFPAEVAISNLSARGSVWRNRHAESK